MKDFLTVTGVLGIDKYEGKYYIFFKNEKIAVDTNIIIFLIPRENGLRVLSQTIDINQFKELKITN